MLEFTILPQSKHKLDKGGCYTTGVTKEKDKNKDESMDQRSFLHKEVLVMSKVIEISEENFEAEVLTSELPVLVDFWAPWCGPCRMMGPIIDEISEENLELKVCKVNVDDASDLARKYNVESIPTLIYFKNGVVRATMIGLRTKQDIMNEIS